MRIGIADTTFARVDMAAVAMEAIRKESENVAFERYTVPGFKDLPVAAKKLIEERGCEIVLAFGWVGKEDIDETCASEANIGLINAELATNVHILKVFVHEREGDEKKLVEIARDRVAKHALNALALVKGREELKQFAGKGRRQGGKDVGGLR